MAAETLPYQNGVVSNGDLGANSNSSSAAKKSRESERRRRRRKQKKNNSKAFQEPNAAEDGDDTKENTDTHQVVKQVEIEYVPEKAELDEDLDKEFRKIFEKFSFGNITGSEDNDKKDESAENATTNKKADSDSEEEENNNEQKEKGVSNKEEKASTADEDC